MVTTTTGLATSFIQFSRTSNATVTDSDGKIKWAGHNLLTNSESFDASAWVKSLSTVSANTHPAPNGTTTADTLAATSANGWVLSNYTSLGSVSYTFGVWLKRKTGTGNIQITTDDNLAWVTVSVTSDWALYTVSQTPTSGTKSAGVRVVTSGDEVYVWGAHLYRSDLGGMVLNPARGDAYYPTTPRSLVGWTEDFSNAAWSKSSTSVSTNLAIAPNGLQTADLLYPASTGTGRQTFHTAACVSGTRYMNSFYVKSAGFRWIALISPRGITYGVYFDIINGVKGTEAGGCTGTITPVGDGWFRCTVTDVTASTTAYSGFVLVDADNSTTATANGTSGAYFWGAQLSDSASLDAYSPVYGAAVTSAAYYAPRLDFDPVTLAARGLLVEEQRTNLLQRTAEFDNAYWAKTASVSVTANYDLAPDGTLTADRFVSTGGSYPQMARTISLTAGLSYTFSMWVKSDGTAQIAQAMLVEGVPVAFTPTTTWTRIAVTVASSAGGSVAVVLSTNSPSAPASSFLIWGAQLEQGSFATSYIPNIDTTNGVTRTADVASVSTQAFPYSASEGTLVAAYQLLANTGTLKRVFDLYDTTKGVYENIIAVNGVNPAQTTIFAEVVNGSSSQASFNLGTPSVGVNKSALAFKVNDFNAAHNGVVGTTDPTGTVPTANTLRIGAHADSTVLNGWIRQITYLPRRISNTELQARTV